MTPNQRQEFADGSCGMRATVNVRDEPWAANSKYCPDVAGYFRRRGMIFAESDKEGAAGAPAQPIEKAVV